MKIICTTKELAVVIRECQTQVSLNKCAGCVLAPICEDQNLEDAIELSVQEAGNAG